MKTKEEISKEIERVSKLKSDAESWRYKYEDEYLRCYLECLRSELGTRAIEEAELWLERGQDE